MEVNSTSRMHLSSHAEWVSMIPWIMAGIPAGLLFLLASVLEARWFYLLTAGAAIVLVSFFFQDRKFFYLLVFSATISIGLVLHLGLKPSSVYRSTHAYLIYLCHLPLTVLIPVHMVRSLREGGSFFTTPAALAASVSLLTVSALAVVFGDASPYGWFDLFALSTSLVVFLAAANVIGEKRELEGVLVVILLSVALQGIIASAQYLTRSSLGLELFGAPKILSSYAGLSKVSRSGGTLGHPNNLALYLDLFLPLGLSLFLCPTLSRRRPLVGLAVFLGLMGLASTLSRGGLLAMGVVVVAILLVHWRKHIGLLRAGFAVLALISLAGILLLTTPNPIQKRFSKYDYGAGYGRYSLALVSMNVIRENPLLGTGLNRFTEAAWLVDNTPEGIVSLWNAPVHNLLLFITSETGVLGLVAFLWVLGLVLFALKAPLHSSDPVIAYTGLGTIMGFVAFLIHCQVDYVHWTHFNPFWFLAGIAISLRRIARLLPTG